MTPAQYAVISNALPIIQLFLGGKKANFVESRLLHKTLGVSRNHPTWLKGQIEKHNLVEGRDYIVQAIASDDHESFARTTRESKNSFDKSTLLTSRASCKIATHTAGEVGDTVYNYLFDVADMYTDEVIAKHNAVTEKLKSDIAWMEQRDD